MYLLTKFSINLKNSWDSKPRNPFDVLCLKDMYVTKAPVVIKTAFLYLPEVGARLADIVFLVLTNSVMY